MYGVPNEVDHLSQGFTLGMYLLGTTLFATAIGTYASLVVHEAIMLVREPPPPADKPEDLDEDGRVGVQDYITWRIGMVFKFIRWEEYKSRYVTLGLTAGWFLFGCLYASVYEGSGLFMAIYFALGAMSCSGSPPPVCIGADATQCSLGTFRAAFYTVYILVGAPLFALAMGQFAGVVVARAEAAAQLQQMSRPIQDREYIYALSLKNLVNKTGSNASDKLRTMYEEYQRHLRRMAPGRASDGLLRMHSKYGSFYSIGNGSIDGGDVSSDGFLDRPNSGKIQNPLAGTSLDFGEFVILELLRLQRVDVSDIERMRTVYSAMDLDASGKLEYSDINKRRFLHEAHFDP